VRAVAGSATVAPPVRASSVLIVLFSATTRTGPLMLLPEEKINAESMMEPAVIVTPPVPMAHALEAVERTTPLMVPVTGNAIVRLFIAPSQMIWMPRMPLLGEGA
jgi:hypothetical protein